jgi:hypothetical protein
MYKINILFCGQIRNPQLFYKSIFKLSTKKYIEKIYLSTWNDEVDESLKLFSAINPKFKFVSEKEPDYKKYNNGSIFYQMKALENGLKLIENKKIKIFKTRPDLFIRTDAIKQIISLNYKIENDSIFHEKIWIPFFEISKPFYFADECFYGTYDDIKLLINYETYYDSLTLGHGQSHVRRFSHPYLENNIELKKYFEKYQNTHFGEKRFKVINQQLLDKEYLNYLFYNYFILNRDFRIGIGNRTEYMSLYKYHNGLVNPDENDFLNAFDPDNSFKPNLGHIFSFTEIWLRKVVNSEKFINNIKKNPILIS